MNKFLILTAFSLLLTGCAAGGLLSDKRRSTTADVMQSWIGSSSDELIIKWGPPYRSQVLSDGSTLIMYRNVWTDGAYNSHLCDQKFLVEHNIVTKWVTSNCETYSGVDGVPKTTPIPKPTLN